jgi:hypothetical protein
MQVSNTNRGFAPTTLAEAVQFSEMLASSSMVPRAYQGKPQDVLVCVQWGYEMGLAPMQALAKYCRDKRQAVCLRRRSYGPGPSQRSL